MHEPEVHFTDKLQETYHAEFIPDIKQRLDHSYVESGVKQLLQNCKAAYPLPFWDELAAVPLEDDAASILQLLQNAGESQAGSVWQLSLADPHSTATPGQLLLFAGKPELLTHTSTFAAAVEQAIADQPEDVQDWARFHLTVGYLGLIVLQHLSPLQPTPPSPESFNPENGTLYAVGLEDYTNFFIGMKSGEKFEPMLEWN